MWEMLETTLYWVRVVGGFVIVCFILYLVGVTTWTASDEQAQVGLFMVLLFIAFVSSYLYLSGH